MNRRDFLFNAAVGLFLAAPSTRLIFDMGKNLSRTPAQPIIENFYRISYYDYAGNFLTTDLRPLTVLGDPDAASAFYDPVLPNLTPPSYAVVAHVKIEKPGQQTWPDIDIPS